MFRTLLFGLSLSLHLGPTGQYKLHLLSKRQGGQPNNSACLRNTDCASGCCILLTPFGGLCVAQAQPGQICGLGQQTTLQQNNQLGNTGCVHCSTGCCCANNCCPTDYCLAGRPAYNLLTPPGIHSPRSPTPPLQAPSSLLRILPANPESVSAVWCGACYSSCCCRTGCCHSIYCSNTPVTNQRLGSQDPQQVFQVPNVQGILPPAPAINTLASALSAAFYQQPQPETLSQLNPIPVVASNHIPGTVSAARVDSAFFASPNLGGLFTDGSKNHKSLNSYPVQNVDMLFHSTLPDSRITIPTSVYSGPNVIPSQVTYSLPNLGFARNSNFGEQQVGSDPVIPGNMAAPNLEEHPVNLETHINPSTLADFAPSNHVSATISKPDESSKKFPVQEITNENLPLILHKLLSSINSIH